MLTTGDALSRKPGHQNDDGVIRYHVVLGPIAHEIVITCRRQWDEVDIVPVMAEAIIQSVADDRLTLCAKTQFGKVRNFNEDVIIAIDDDDLCAEFDSLRGWIAAHYPDILPEIARRIGPTPSL